jgi:hypothetical protein
MFGSVAIRKLDVLLFLVGGCRSNLELFAIVVGAVVVACVSTTAAPATTHTTIHSSRRNRLSAPETVYP